MKKIITISILGLTLFFFYKCANKSIPAAGHTYIGSGKCQSCHQNEFALYKTSDHYHAMDTVSAAAVKGDFNNSSLIYQGDTAFFYQKNGQYIVRTTDTTGVKKEFRISYTFGWRPLQQYLVKFDDGRFQVLPFCWDTREKEKGGQRWFHLYDKEKIAPDDELFWMGINQNWNYMCADCHTTNYTTNFNLAENKFNSTWNESRVSCESCHGPASGHLQWSDKQNNTIPFKGFAISLAAKPIKWQMDAVKQIMLPETIIKNDTLIETCARCHARATRFTDRYNHGQSFLQSHIPAAADPVNYYIDGQIKEEDYEYASFLQNKMHAAGVTCINCHEPHSMKVKILGNGLCTSCHSPAKYDGPRHSFHQQLSTGNQCVNCHMPVTTYMVIDNRLDHSIRIPRPDHSLLMGTPNACNKCHKDKSLQWAASAFVKWFGTKLPKEKTYPELMYAISRYVQESEPSLYELLLKKNYPAIIKATAMEQYGYYTSSRISSLITEELKSSDPMLRLSATKAMANYPPETILTFAPSLLNDPVAAVRMEVVSLLAPVSSRLFGEELKQFTKVMNEYLNVQEQMSHRPEGFFNRAIVKNFIGLPAAAEQLYISCIQRFPGFVPAYANLVDLYRQQNREGEAKKIIDKGLLKHPNSAHLHYALGLWYVRNKENVNGLEELKTAATNNPSDAQFVYGYAIGLFSKGEAVKSLQLLEQFLSRYGNHPVILEGLISIYQDLQQTEKATKYAAIRKDVFGY